MAIAGPVQEEPVLCPVRRTHGRFQVGECSALSCWWLCAGSQVAGGGAEPGSVLWASAPVLRGLFDIPDAKATC